MASLMKRRSAGSRNALHNSSNTELPLYVTDDPVPPSPAGFAFSPVQNGRRASKPATISRSPSPPLRSRSLTYRSPCRCFYLICRYAFICIFLALFGYSILYSSKIKTVVTETTANHSPVISAWMNTVLKDKGGGNKPTPSRASPKPTITSEMLEEAKQENERLIADLANVQAELVRATTHSANLVQENEKYMHVIELLKQENEHLTTQSQSERREEMAGEIIRLKEEIQKISRTEVMKKFGPGPHRVEFELKFPLNAPSAPDGSNPTTFVIELASLNVMPHAVYTFLQMVDHGLWVNVKLNEDGEEVTTTTAVFDDIESHIALAHPLRHALENFVNIHHGIATMAFPEYTPDYDHEQYTVGFAGTPPGPNFYISLEDNREFHVGDPCFGKIISGFDTVHRLSNVPKEGTLVDPPVEIVRVGWAEKPDIL